MLTFAIGFIVGAVYCAVVILALTMFKAAGDADRRAGRD